MTDDPDGSHYAGAAEAEAECGSKPVVTIPATVLPGNFAGVKWNSCCHQHRVALDAAGIPWRADDDEPSCSHYSRWIPVSERLPEVDVDVLGFVPDGGKGAVRTAWREFRHQLGGKAIWRSHAFRYENITHWMPLPEPPQ